jgi:AcrR family transcriptional regulator
MRTLDPAAHALTERRILDAARALFAESGYHSASMNDVAKAAKLAKAALYHYFPSKQAMLEALHEQLWRETEDQLVQLPRFKTLRQALKHTGKLYLAHFGEPHRLQMTQICFKMGAGDAALREKSQALVQPRMDGHLLKLFGPFFPKGTKPEKVKLFALQFFGGLFYRLFVLETLCPMGQRHEPMEKYLDQLVDIYAAAPQALMKAKGAK